MSESAIQQKTNDPTAGMGFTPSNLAQAIALSEMLGKSGLVPKAIAGKPSDILVVLLTGHELGLGPMASLRLLSVIDGKAVIGGEAYAAVVQAAPECEYLRCTASTDKLATFVTRKRGSAAETSLTWTIEQATKAGLTGKDNWRKYPEAMLRWRCVSAIAKLEFPHRFAGVYVPDEEDEIGSVPNGELGQVIDLRPTTDKLADRMKSTATAQADLGGTQRAPSSAKPAQRTVDVVATNPTAKVEPDQKPANTDLPPANSAAVKAAGGITTSEMDRAGPPPVPPEGPLMVFGGSEIKGLPIAKLSGPQLLEMAALGRSKMGTLDGPKKAKVQACVDAIDAEQKRREKAMVDDLDVDAPEPGSAG